MLNEIHPKSGRVALGVLMPSVDSSGFDLHVRLASVPTAPEFAESGVSAHPAYVPYAEILVEAIKKKYI